MTLLRLPEEIEQEHTDIKVAKALGIIFLLVILFLAVRYG